MNPITPETLTLPFDKWKEFVEANNVQFDELDRAWLGFWNLLDLSLSPIDDDLRRFLRLGHYTGWIDCIKKIRSMTKLVFEESVY